MNFIKKIAENKVDSFTHWSFIRYGLGEYEKEPLVINKTRSKLKFKGGFEYVNAFHGFMASLAEQDIQIQGSIVTSKDIKEKLVKLGIELIAIEKLRGKSAFKYLLNTTVSVATYKQLFQEVSDCFMLFNAEDSVGRKIKVKGDKPPKIGSPKPGFARMELPLADEQAVKQEFLWDIPALGHKHEIIHTYIIDNIEVPKGFEDDAIMARQKAIRKGRIKRIVIVDDRSWDSEIPLEA